MRPSRLVSLLEQEFSSVGEGFHTPVMLWGPPGVGKSRIVARVAEVHAVALIDIRLSQLEPSDLRGIPFRSGESVQWAIPAMLPDRKRHGERGILFLDEINAAPPSVSAAAYQLVLDRCLGEYRIPDGWVIVAAGNRQGDRGVTYNMPAPLANRFSHYELEVNLDDWVMWAHHNHIDERLIAFLRFKPELLFEFDPTRDAMAFPTPRSWEFVHRSLQKFGAGAPLLLDACAACVGQAAAVELTAFIDNLDQLPDIEAIVAGNSQDVPAEVDLQYAVASALVARAVRADAEVRAQVLGNILDYASCFPLREMGVMLVHDLARAVGEDVYACAQFTAWARDVGQILI